MSPFTVTIAKDLELFLGAPEEEKPLRTTTTLQRRSAAPVSLRRIPGTRGASAGGKAGEQHSCVPPGAAPLPDPPQVPSPPSLGNIKYETPTEGPKRPAGPAPLVPTPLVPTPPRGRDRLGRRERRETPGPSLLRSPPSCSLPSRARLLTDPRASSPAARGTCGSGGRCLPPPCTASSRARAGQTAGPGNGCHPVSPEGVRRDTPGERGTASTTPAPAHSVTARVFTAPKTNKELGKELGQSQRSGPGRGLLPAHAPGCRGGAGRSPLCNTRTEAHEVLVAPHCLDLRLSEHGRCPSAAGSPVRHT